MKEVQAYPVVFKLLGTLRMVIDGQEKGAKLIARDSEFLQKLVEYCSLSEHPGIEGESQRLMASIVKNGQSSDVVRQVMAANGVQPLVGMISSEHEIMRSEAFMSLSVLFTCLSPSEVQSVAEERGLAATLGSHFKARTDHPNKAPIIGNSLALIEVILKKWPEFKSHLNQEQLKESLNEIKFEEEVNQVQNQMNNILKLL
jgi:hypothetical protein